MLHNVYLYGHLADEYGAGPYEIDADNIYVLISGLANGDSKMKMDIMNDEVGYILINSPKDYFILTPEIIMCDISNYKEVHILPRIEGDAPAVLVGLVAGVVGAGIVAEIIAAVIYVGLMMAISYGLGALLSPSPNLAQPAQQAQDASSKQSFLFNGAVNVAEQGGPVQIVYGKMRTGSTVISAGITTADY